MVDIEITGLGPGSAVIRGVPATAVGVAVAADGDVGAIALQDGFTRVAVAGDGDPVREQTTAIPRGIGGAGAERGKEGARVGGGGDVGGRTFLERCSSGRCGREEEVKEVVHGRLVPLLDMLMGERNELKGGDIYINKSTTHWHLHITVCFIWQVGHYSSAMWRADRFRQFRSLPVVPTGNSSYIPASEKSYPHVSRPPCLPVSTVVVAAKSETAVLRLRPTNHGGSRQMLCLDRRMSPNCCVCAWQISVSLYGDTFSA
jgi:hypothetical protein